MQDVITATPVSDSKRLTMLPRYGGRYMCLLEACIYRAMRAYCKDYSGGYWYMYELDNGAFYMAPGRTERMALSWSGNYFDGEMSADAAGIIACLMAFNQLAWHDTVSGYCEHFTDLFHALREFALQHDESSMIMAAID